MIERPYLLDLFGSWSYSFLFYFIPLVSSLVSWCGRLHCLRNTCKYACVRLIKHACKHDQMWKDRLQHGRAGEHSNNLYASASACFTERTFQILLLLLSFMREACCGFEPGQSWEDLNSQIAQGPLPPWQHPSHIFTLSQRETLKTNANGEFRVDMWSIQLAPIAVCSILFFVRNYLACFRRRMMNNWPCARKRAGKFVIVGNSQSSNLRRSAGSLQDIFSQCHLQFKPDWECETMMRASAQSRTGGFHMVS